MAYAALDSLAEILYPILDHENDSCHGDCRKCVFLGNNRQIEDAVSLSKFLEGFPREAPNFNLIARLRNAATRAKSMFDEFGLSLDENGPEIHESIKTVDYILQKALQIKSSSKTLSFFQPRLKPIAKEAVVELDESCLIEIKNRLYGEPSFGLDIIQIVGMGGIGKTTLARYTYQDPSTTHHFDVCAWATVSQNSSAEIVLSNLLCYIDPSNKEKYQNMDNGGLVQNVHKYLKKRRYLIVMDDMWDTNVWDDVSLAFPDDCNGSRIIITTRNLDIASYIDSLKKHLEIQLMSIDQSWRLLKERVFGQENCPSELEKIGKHIAEKCKGLPLAIVVIAGVLSKLEQKQESWGKIARNVSKTVNTSSEEQFTDILSVSYMHLPPRLRHCFLYTACFPEDYEINVSTLIGLWAAEGFLLSDDLKDMEELGYENLEDLTRRSLVLVEKKGYDGKIEVVKIHDVLRDLCIRKSRDENFLCTINEFEGRFPQGIENSHRLSICSNVWGCIPNMEGTPIYTILFFSGHWAFKYWKHFKLLKVLDATTVALKSWVFELSDLIHLRYLALAFDTSDFRILVHESLSNLRNLRTLVVRQARDYFTFHAYLPVAIWRMPQLRHIILLNGFLPHPATNDFKEVLPLRNMRTLYCINNFTCSERILELLPNLKTMEICYWASDLDETGWLKYGLYNLVNLHCLENLKISLHNFYNKSDMAQNLAFPITPKRLTLSGCVVPWEEMTIIGSLPNLELLRLNRNTSHGTIWATSKGEFCQLKVLTINTTDLQQWVTTSSHFPRLERLTLCKCNNLQEIPFDIGEIPTLQLIEVDIKNFSVVLSAKLIQEEQQSFGNDLEVSLLVSKKKKLNYRKHNSWEANISRNVPEHKISRNELEAKTPRNVSEAVNTSSDKLFLDVPFASYMQLPPHLRPCFHDTTCSPEGIEYSHFVTVSSNISGSIPGMESSPTYSMVIFKNWAFDFWISFRFLTMVKASSVTFTSRSNSSIRHIGELVHMRHLELSCEATQRTQRLVSESLYQLQNLRFLIVMIRKIIEQLRSRSLSLKDEDSIQCCMKFEIWRMPQLRHLVLLDGVIPYPSAESFQDISALENLRTLFHIQDFRCTESVLQIIPNLKKLGIIHKGTCETGWSEYGLKNLVHLHKLENLSLSSEPYPNLMNDVLSENISFPVTLKRLNLTGCRFPWKDMRMIGKLPNLKVLRLLRHACHGTEWETSEREFCQLKELVIYYTDLHQWILYASSFPRLESLTLFKCKNLREVPNGFGDIPTLRLIEVDIRDLCVVESAKQIQEEQQRFGNVDLQVRFLKSSWRVGRNMGRT